MKAFLVILSLIVGQFIFASEVDLANSKLVWVGKKVTGEHRGTLQIESANLEVKNGKVVSGEIVANMKSIAVTDLSGEFATKLKNHLESDDFFSIQKYPKATFKLTEVIYPTDGSLKAQGELTLKGKTLNSKKSGAQLKLKNFKQTGKKITGTLVFDRTAYNIRYGSGRFFDNLGDKMIYDDVEVQVHLALK